MKFRPPWSSAKASDAEFDSDSERTPLDWPRQTGRLELLMEAIAQRKQRRRVRRTQAAGATAAALVVAALFWSSFPVGPGRLDPPLSSQAVLALPERRTLPDGSVVELQDGSEMRIDFDGPLRRVSLLRGSAHFQVTSDLARPFVVEAGGMEFRAVGTAFAVLLGSAAVEMLVTEGSVAVERAAAGDSPLRPDGAIHQVQTNPMVVEAGNQVVVELTKTANETAPQITAFSSAESGEKLSWRVPRLDLNDTPLAEVIAAINRHSSMPVVIRDDVLAQVGISGVLRADNVEPLLQMLESNYAIQADRSEPGRILLRKGR